MTFFADSQIHQYLDRIDYHDISEPSLENLTAIQRQHLLHIPYENLDLMNGVPLDLGCRGRCFKKLF